MNGARTILVSNRLPVTVAQRPDSVTLTASAGGLATGLRSVHDAARDVWIGWPGVASDDLQDPAALARQLRDLGYVPVFLSSHEIDGYYDQYSNGTIWPLFHGQLTRMPLEPAPWHVYESVNAQFADVVHAQIKPGDLVWVHDYQLTRVPHLLRQQCDVSPNVTPKMMLME